MKLVTCGLLFVGTPISALQFGARSGDDSQKTVAWCLTGSARTFPDPAVWKSFKDVLDHSGAVGHVRKTQPDVFAYVASEDATAYTGRDQVDTKKEKIEATLKAVNAVRYRVVQSPEDISEETLSEHVAHLDECYPTEGFYWSRRMHMANSLNQLLHFGKCMELVDEQESHNGVKYDVVVLSRPDLQYDAPASDYADQLFSNVYNGTAAHESDHWMALPRKVAQRLMPAGPKLLTCAPGQKCCKKIGRSEDMFEYKLGMPIAYSGPCKCSDHDAVPNEIIRHWGIFGDEYARH